VTPLVSCLIATCALIKQVQRSQTLQWEIEVMMSQNSPTVQLWISLRKSTLTLKRNDARLKVRTPFYHSFWNKFIIVVYSKWSSYSFVKITFKLL